MKVLKKNHQRSEDPKGSGPGNVRNVRNAGKAKKAGGGGVPAEATTPASGGAAPGVASAKTVMDLLSMWVELANIRDALVAAVAKAAQDVVTYAPRLEAARGTPFEAAFRDVVEGSARRAEDALRTFDAELARHLKRTDPPWRLASAFRDALPGTAEHRGLAFERAIESIVPLVEQRRGELRAASWLPHLPPDHPRQPPRTVFDANCVQRAAAAVYYATIMEHRYSARPEPGATLVRSEALVAVAREIVTNVMSNEVADIVLGQTEDLWNTAGGAASEVLARVLGISGTTVRQAVTVAKARRAA